MGRNREKEVNKQKEGEREIREITPRWIERIKKEKQLEREKRKCKIYIESDIGL